MDFANRLITVQRSFTTPTKTNKVRRGPILNPLLPVLGALKEAEVDDVLVFPNNAGQMQNPAAKVFKDVPPLSGAREAAQDDLSRPAAHLRVWMLKGGDIFRLQKVLGHASVTTT